jgi:hypothetical protein
MLVVAAGTIQALLLSDMLLRRVLFLCLPSKRLGLQRYADNAALSSFAVFVLQTVTVPVQAVASIVATLGRFWALIVFAGLCFAALLTLSSSSVYAYTVLARMYNVGVAPVATAMQWLFVLLDFVFRAVSPLWNGFSFFTSEILRKIVLPYSFHNIETLPEMLQGLTLMLVSLGGSVGTWLQNIMECTLVHEPALRVCGESVAGRKTDCTAMFTPIYTQCFAAPNHMTVDLLTPGLFARQAALALRRLVAAHCGVAALVLNLLLFPLAELHLYAAVHASVNTLLFAVIGLPVTTVRRCEAAMRKTEMAEEDLSSVQEVVACTPDWQPLALMMTSALESFGEVFNNWLNAAALLARDRIGSGGEETSRCDVSVRMSSIVLDAARAIEGLESIESLERLQGKGGLPDSETLLRVRVVGVTPRIFAVTDGKAVLYRGAHDGYVWAYGAWPFEVDVRLGLAAVSYSGSATETDSSGDARTGLLGCRCVDDTGFTLLCATAPYVQHIDNDAAGLKASATHTVSFPELSLLGMTCSRTAVRVMPLRWPRRRLATADGGGTGYERFSYADVGRRLQGDTDSTDSLRLLEKKHRATPAGAVEAAIFVQPLCGDSNVACALAADNCFPWCMGVVRGGARAQNVTMFNTARWESHVLLPDVDCGVARDSSAKERGECGDTEGSSSASTIVDMMSRVGVVRADCRPESTCTPSPVAAVVSSLVALSVLKGTNSSEIGLVQEHKSTNWLGVRLEQQPFVVAGDVLLSVGKNIEQRAVVVVTRLFDIGHGSLQMLSERLTLTSNSHAIEIAECSTQADRPCIEQAMADGKVVLPLAFYQVQSGRPPEHSDGGEVPGVLPAAASRWGVHWAANPSLAVYTAVFDFCAGKAEFNLLVHSSFGPALVWTAHTMRSVDLEGAGSPSVSDIKSRVSYMRVPEFFGDFFTNELLAKDYCGAVVGLKIVGVEYINAENVLVTVLAARPRDYNPHTGAVAGPRMYRHYFLHPSQHNCFDNDNILESSMGIFSCWRSQESGMWQDDTMLVGGVGGAVLDSKNMPCVEARLLPAFGSAVVMPAIALVAVLETAMDTLCTLTAVVVSNPGNPFEAMRQLGTVPLRKASFHSMVDSGGARLLNVEEIIAAVHWCARFNAHLLIHALKAFSGVVSGITANKHVDKTLAGMRTIVIGASKIKEGGGTDIPMFKDVEAMFAEPIQFSAMHASTAVLRMSDGLQGSVRLPLFVSTFMRAQASMVGCLSLVLRLGRTMILRLLQAGADAPAAVASAALLESVSIVEDDFLNVMRFQCYGLAQIVGATKAWGHALQHACLLFPDSLEGVLTVVTVLTLDYPTVACACKLGDGDTLGENALDAVKRICLLRPLPIEETQWLTALALAQNDRREVCFATMDSANARLRTAFDKTHQRMFQMTQHAAGVADALLALVTGDSSACDAFDVSPYVMSIIPEPVDYFSACVDTEDCRVRCLEEYNAFDAAKHLVVAAGVELGFSTDIPVTLESMFFSSDDIEQGRNKPPFMILDVVELPVSSCSVVCAGAASGSNRCIVVGGLRTEADAKQNIGIAYYCLPLDVSQYAFQWGVDGETQGTGNFPLLPDGLVVSLHLVTTWAPQESLYDSIVAVVRVPDTSITSSTSTVLEPLTQVLLFTSNRPVPLLIMRTSMRIERQLDVDMELPRGAGFLHKIEHVQVDIAERRDSFFVVQVRGYYMQRVRIANSEQFMWHLPQKACVRCEVLIDLLSANSAQVDCSKQCVDNDGNLEALDKTDDAQFDFVSGHMRVCLLERESEKRPQISVGTQVCDESIFLPRTLPSTAFGPADYANLRLRVLDNGAFWNKDIRVPPNVVAILQVDSVQRSYRDMQKQVQARVSLLSRVHYMRSEDLARLRALATSDIQDTILSVVLEIITANARDVHGGWLHVLQLGINGGGASASLRNSLRAETSASVLMACTVHNCGACAHSAAGHDTDGELMQLENICYAAKQCGVERCAGTLVNMRKPLCNLGKVLTSELHSVRVLLQAVWNTVADKIGSTVELTHSRREIFEIRWPMKSMQQTTCTAKDSIVSMAATFTSMLGAVSHLMVDISLSNGHSAANVDTRAHARYIMVLAATTNLLTAAMLWPVYQAIVLQKFVACTATDVSYTISRVVDAGSNGMQPKMVITFRDNMDQAAESSGVATCLTEDVRQSLEDAGARIKDMQGGDTPVQQKILNSADKITRIISDAISSTIDTLLAARVQFMYHYADIVITWGIGVIKGIMDIVQTVDWENCKLPVVDTGMRSLGGCPCHDKPYSIPQKQKNAAWTDIGFWCSGLLMLNEGDGSDSLVWNPFSLSELLALPGARNSKTMNELVSNLLEDFPESTDYDLYIICMRQANSACEYFKPQDPRLSQQGIEVMQVVSRCRENYKQGRWDEASVLYALFSVKEWRTTNTLELSVSAGLDDTYSQLRKRILTLIAQDRSSWTPAQTGIAMPAWGCLSDALSAGMMRHDCHRSVATFEYLSAIHSNPIHTDACRVTASSSTRRFPRMLWSGSSKNHVPIARLHPVQMSPQNRSAQAYAKIQAMIETEIRPLFANLMQTDFSEELKKHINVNAFSVEGDQLHQMVDCVVLGPFAAAELNANVHLPNMRALPVPQYHRGSSYSRDFTSWGPTGGSEARKMLMRQVLEHVDEHAQDVLVRSVSAHVRSIADKWLDIGNFLCPCARGQPAMSCCSSSKRQDIVFGVSLDEQTWDISSNVIEESFQHVAQAGVLDTLWLQRIGEPVMLSAEERSETIAAHLFAASGRVPVGTYDSDNGVTVLNDASLWEWCTGRVAGLFASMPLTSKATNENEGRVRNSSIPHVPHTDYAYDPAIDIDDAPSRDHDKARQHSMELLVDKLLRRSRELAPHFWTHSHRYVASDSVWCEQSEAQTESVQETLVPASLHEQYLRRERVLAPDMHEIVYPADVLRRCPCGWGKMSLGNISRAGIIGCIIPQEICEHGRVVLADADILADGSSKRAAWDALCAAPYTAHSDSVIVLQVLATFSGPALSNCSARELSTAWGLLAQQDYDAWYTGSTGKEQESGTWAFGAQHLASAGPGGLRLGMLSPSAPVSMQEHMREFELGERLEGTLNARYEHTIGQPVCNNTLLKLLREELDEYFVDTLIPMAHSMQIVPAVEYCVRWVIEHAMMSLLLHAEQQETQHERRERMRVLVVQQQTVADEWKDKCSVQMLDIGICALRGVYDMAPPTAKDAPPSCAIAGQDVTGCSHYYYTSGCILFCDGVFYDPCLCKKQDSGQGSVCLPLLFEPSQCPAGALVDGRSILASEEGVLTSSLLWPLSIPIGEAANETQLNSMHRELEIAHKFAKFDTVALATVFDRAKQELLGRPDTESLPHAYCDDLLDYWPDVQHPVGYHPTSACTSADTHTRGFPAWMSRSEDGTPLIDPVRMRNASYASQVFGAAHLVCDAYAYAAPGHKLNPFYMQSKWKPDAVADPAIPRQAPPVTLEEMPFLGTPSKEQTDTTFRTQGHPAEALTQHTVGLVRAWALWEATDNEEYDTAQAELDKRWPHWTYDESFGESSGLFLSSRGSAPPAGCDFPTLYLCDDDFDCASSSNIVLRCLKGAASERGVCMEENTCFEHAHCAALGLLCSGEGTCSEAVLRVRNEANMSADVQLFTMTGQTSMQKLSLFESVPDFAKANGMCSFRNWFHFINTTAGIIPRKNIINVRNRLVHYTNNDKPEMLRELNVLKTNAHPCDRSYAHTNYNVYSGPAHVKTSSDSVPAEKLLVMKTWSEEDGELYARFCNMFPSRAPSGFLNPYVPASGTLQDAAGDVRRCSEFGMCPTVYFHVGGRTVDARRVLTYAANEDSLYGVKAVTEQPLREYCGLDAQRCLAMGYMLGLDCAEVDKEESQVCVVDRLVLPLVSIVFEKESLSQLAKLVSLRIDCPRAFTLPFKGKRDLELFTDAEYYLTRPYSWTDKETLNRVLRYANSLPWLLFGMTEEQESAEQRDGRSFSSVLDYTQHSQCAVFLAKALLVNQKLLDASSIYDNSWRTSKTDSNAAMPVVPGASLYLFVESVPVAISLRWFMQCVVLAANIAEGGVQARFLAQLNAGTTDYDYVECQNYLEGIANHNVNGAVNEDVTLPLDKWLRTAPFLFTQMDSTDGANVGLHALQINADVSYTISYAIDQLQVFEIPDLLCVDTSGWSVLTTQQNIRNIDLWRYSIQDAESENTRVGGFSRQLDRVSNTSIHKQVLDFLTAGKYKWDVDSTVVTIKDLLLAGVIRQVREHMHATVIPKEVYPEYEYVQLSAAHMASLAEERTLDEETYVFSAEASTLCTCNASADRDCRKLKNAEYSMLGTTTCENSKVLECNDNTERLLDRRLKHMPPFLQQHELLYLVLLIIKNEIQNTVSGGFMALHRLREPADVQAISEIFDVQLPNQAQTLSLVEAQQFNDFVRNRKAISFKCPPKSTDTNQQTNLMHTALRQCRVALQESVGWKLPASSGGITRTLEVRPQAYSLLSGFYPAFLLRNKEQEHRTFLDTLIDTPWELPEFAQFERAVCHEYNSEISVMAPFWAEMFDVATNVAGEDSSSDPPIACDMIQSSFDSTLMVYSTLCSASASSTRSCAEHPEYEQHVLNTLPEVCAQKHGQPVVRSRLGALRRGLTPLCQLQPTIPDTCDLKHGTLHGHRGQSITDLDRKDTISALQTGFWNKKNSIFRGVLTEHNSEQVPALGLDTHDIGGHCLEFSISEQGWLYLHRARLTSDCQQIGGHVRTWLQNIEQDWAWEDHYARELLLPQESEDVSWQCPLHWLQRFHDDNSKHQARGPSWSRNKARFKHITGEYAYAHPTVRNTHKLRGVRAARWMSDTMGCVAADERECHSAAYLTHTLSTLLADSTDWHAVAYVPADTDECARVLDWPSDCGLATAGAAQGQCFMRQ